jgi:hypothetical protein
MRFSQFYKSLNTDHTIVESVHSYGNTIQKTDSNLILVNNEETEYTSLEEARKHIKLQQESEILEQEITEELYEEIDNNTIANIIKEHYNVKITDTLIESYIEFASSNLFTVDPVVYEIRKLNKLDRIVENKIHYKLSDGSIVAISEATQMQLNTLLEDQEEIVEHMRKSKENFLFVLEKLEE